MSETGFQLAGAELDWPIGSAAGMTNHPDIETVARRTEGLASIGLGFVVGGSWTLGEPRGGSAYEWTGTGWDYKGGDEYVDLTIGAGFNAKDLPGPGTDMGMERLDDLIDIARSRGTEFALSLSPHGDKPLEELRELTDVARRALAHGALFVEMDLSCPSNVDRPPLYRDGESLSNFYQWLAAQEPLLNKHDWPGLYHKFGPFQPGSDVQEYYPPGGVGGGVVTSNSLGNQMPKLPNGEPAVQVNDGRAGMGGPALSDFGREQLGLWVRSRNRLRHAGGVPVGEVISVLGIAHGAEVKARLDGGADAVELASALYWPELTNHETPAEVVDQIKVEFVEASSLTFSES